MCGESIGNCLFYGRIGMLLLLFELAKYRNNDHLNTYAFTWLEHLYLEWRNSAQRDIPYIDLVSMGWLLAEGRARDYFDIDIDEAYYHMDSLLVKDSQSSLSSSALCITLMYVNTRLQLAEAEAAVNSLVLQLCRNEVSTYTSLQLSVLSALYRKMKQYLSVKNRSLFHAFLVNSHDQKTSMEETESRAVTRLLFYPDVALQEEITNQSPGYVDYQAVHNLSLIHI